MFTVKLTKNQLTALICLALALVTTALYWPISHHDFVNFDDDDYITNNSHVQAGLTWGGVIWAFQTGAAANWHPLTWLSHMLDCQLYGLYPGGHHSTNLLFHVVNTLLLFLWLRQLTGALWRSAFVAALFAWHPLHVESVAWAAERKDVLSAFFWMLALMAYTRYVTSDKWRVTRADPASSPVTRHPSLHYFLALFFFACGLMSKPMVVTLPFVLLLLDFWPLNRFSSFQFQISSSEEPSTLNHQPSTESAFRLIYEKLPFFALTLAAGVVTYSVQTSGRTLWSPAERPFSSRVANALWAYERYISKTFWPADLSIFYPYPHHWPAGLVIGAASLLAIWSGLLIWRARQNPCLFVGWFWFLGTLIPTIGLVQVGSQSMADRYMYIPSVGLFILVAWGFNDFLNWRPHWRRITTFAGGVALAGCLVGTEIQLSYWQNSIKLFRHAIEVTTDNFVAYTCLGETLSDLGLKKEAMEFCGEAVEISPNSPVAQYNFGMALLQNNRLDEALAHLDAAARLAPHNSEVQYNFGLFLLLHNKSDEAASHFAAALVERPDFAEAHRRLAQALSQQHKSKEAIFHYHEALRLKPDFADALNELAWILATAPDSGLRSGTEAVQLAKRACELAQNRQAAFLTTLSAAYAETGRFSDAIAIAQTAGKLAQTAGQKKIAAQDGELLKLYQAGCPFRETH
ncbi:MAG: tetratricopeptide repeat protein [Verrucomicrobiota bacterium]|jgi:Flp pilus assembly protein TadD